MGNTYKIPILSENIITLDENNNLDFILPPILNHNKNIIAIFAMSDELLSKNLYNINKLGLAIPEEISIIAISDGVYPYITHPRITHVKDSGSKMGKSASKFLLEAISETVDSANFQQIITTKLVELESVKQI